MASPWWVISVSTLNGQPWQAITFQGDKAAAKSASRGGILAGPFTANAAAAAWGEKWSARTHRQFTNDPGLSSGNPVTGATSGAAAIGASAANSVPGVQQIGGFFASLGRASTWVRVLKVVIGGGLLIIGVAHMTGADNAAFNAARKVPVPV